MRTRFSKKPDRKTEKNKKTFSKKVERKMPNSLKKA